ncbi:MAG: SH3 domain-containing protein [Anaerolineales bacterium]|nr:SH3 domain-containing protein [Anaerolineales bacterium]
MRRMPRGIRFRYILIMVVPLVLAACNRPDLVESAPTSTASALTLEDIEAAVAFTMMVEGALTAAAQPSNTPVPSELSPTATDTAAVPTGTPTEIANCLVVSNFLNLRSGPGVVYDPPIKTLSNGTVLLPFAKNGNGSWLEVKLQGESTTGWVSASGQFISCNFDPSGLSLGQIPPTPTPTNTFTPSPSSTPTSTYTATPTNTPCPKFTNGTLSAKKSGQVVDLTWGSLGGCAPFSGSLTAIYKGESDPYATHKVTTQTGKETDIPQMLDPCREGMFTIVYTLTLRDSAGQTLTATDATVKIIWSC